MKEIMVKWLELPPKDRQAAIQVVSEKTGLPLTAVEKDWWVTLTLFSLFSIPAGKHLLFKGGTSLSKGWGLISRLSEDIDLGLDREMLGFGGELSKTQIGKLKKAACEYTSKELKSQLAEFLAYLKIPEKAFQLTAAEVKPDQTDKDPQQLILEYETLYPGADQYVLPQVQIEVSARSLKEPMSNRPIQSLLSGEFPKATFAHSPFDVSTVNPTRTFLEKAFLLHEEFQKQPDKIREHRMSRHLYDLEKLMDTDHGVKALKDIDLYKAIIKHRETYNKLPGVDYGLHAPSSIDFIPRGEVIKRWEGDFGKMKETMFFGEILSFEDVMKRMEELRQRFRGIKYD